MNKKRIYKNKNYYFIYEDFNKKGILKIVILKKIKKSKGKRNNIYYFSGNNNLEYRLYTDQIYDNLKEALADCYIAQLTYAGNNYTNSFINERKKEIRENYLNAHVNLDEEIIQLYNESIEKIYLK